MSLSNIRVEKSLLRSLAFKKLSQFLMKRKYSKIRGKWVCTNSRELVFTYDEANKNHQYSATKFLRAIDELIKYGFISIVHHGGKTKGNYTLYSLDERWERFGKPDFKDISRDKIYNGTGFAKQIPAYTNDSQK
jgi:hypothetical protein